MTRKTAILVAGPTASGKSATALMLAQGIGGVVVNTDSMQVYADLRVLTARPSPEEEAQAPHRLYGHVDGAVRYSSGAWLADARRVAREAWGQGLVPIFTGGTGLYFRALEEGLADIPAIPGEVRARVADWAAAGPERLREEAARLKLPDAPGDRQRLIRALEVFIATGQPIASFHGQQQPALPADARIIRVFIAPEREQLRQRIAERFHAMLGEGAVKEVQRLLARQLPPDLPVMKAHGVRNIAAALRGEISMDEAAQGAINETRQYAKRQMTWARKFMAHWQWATTPDEAARAALGMVS